VFCSPKEASFRFVSHAPLSGESRWVMACPAVSRLTRPVGSSGEARFRVFPCLVLAAPLGPEGLGLIFLGPQRCETLRVGASLSQESMR
jgi:hypothetical protein